MYRTLTATDRAESGLGWAEDLVFWLESQGYTIRESGPFNAKTGRGWYSHPCELAKNHVRIRVNPHGIIVLRDPGCTIEVTRHDGRNAWVWSPNVCRMDRGLHPIARMREAIESFAARPAYTLAEAQEQFGA